MSLLGSGVLVLVGVITLVILALTWWGWNHWWAPLRVPGRALSLLLVMSSGALVTGAVVNHQLAFYSSLSDLLTTGEAGIPGQKPVPPREIAGTPTRGMQILTPSWQQAGALAAVAGHGSILTVYMRGGASGFARHGFVYLPATYFTSSVHAPLPVIELLHGHPGSPGNFTTQLSIQAILDEEISARRMPPVIAVMPNTYEHVASECADTPGAGRNETYLTRDVPALTASTFAVTPGRSFGILGVSEGGFCAANLGLRHPRLYAAAASLSGYFQAGVDTGTGRTSIYRGDRALVAHNSPSWIVAHTDPRAPALLLIAGDADRFSLAQDAQLRALARTQAPHLEVRAQVVPGSAHSFNTWLQALPAALDFIGARLPLTLEPPNELPEQDQGPASLISPRPPAGSALPSPAPSPSSTPGSPRPGATPSGSAVPPQGSPGAPPSPSSGRPTSPSPAPSSSRAPRPAPHPSGSHPPSTPPPSAPPPSLMP